MTNWKEANWHSTRLNRVMNIRVYGMPSGVPMLIFPTQDAMSDNFENFGMIELLSEDLRCGRIQLFCVDTVDTETWSNIWGDKTWRAQRQEQYYGYIIDEVIPFIRTENTSKRLPIAAGCSLGGLHAAIAFFRRPDLFDGVLALSGVYDAKFFTDGWMNDVLYDNSPLDFVSDRAVGRRRDAARRRSWATCSTARIFTHGWISGAMMSIMTGTGGRSSSLISSPSFCASRHNL